VFLWWILGSFVVLHRSYPSPTKRSKRTCCVYRCKWHWSFLGIDLYSKSMRGYLCSKCGCRQAWGHSSLLKNYPGCRIW
jgi:hypothetical protein